MVTITKHVIPGPDLHCARPLASRGFWQHLPAKYKWWPKKKFYYLSAGPWHCAIWQIQRWLSHYVHKKLRWGREVATFRTKALDFTLVIRLNWSEKINLGGAPGPLVVNIIYCYYCCTRVLLYAKVLKKLKINKQDFFCQIFVIGGISIEGARATWATPWLRLWFWD